MAPVCVARRLSLPLLCLFVLFFIARVNPLLMYNRQTLLDLRLVASDLTNTTYTGHKTLPPFLCGIPANLCRTLAPASRRKRFRRRGKRSGLLVKLKAYLVRSSPAPWNKRGSVPHHVFSPRSLEPIDAWLVPVVASDQMSQPRKIFPHLRRRGANLQNLRPLCRVSQSATNTLTSTRFGLVNTRSLSNKTFISRDLFMTQGLDFLCITETWLRAGESSVFTDLLPDDSCFLNSPRISGRGGGLAVVFKKQYKCKPLPLSTLRSSFELSLSWVALTQCSVLWFTDSNTIRTS